MHPLRFPGVLFILVSLAACHPAASATPAPAATATAAAPSPTATLTQPPTFTPSPTPRPHADRVVIVSLDGLRPDGLLRAFIPRISELINGGASSFTAQTVLPSATLPAHASMLSGRCVSKHGITWNDWIPSAQPLQGDTVFSVAKDAGLRTVMVVGKEKLATLARPGTVDTFLVSGSDIDIARVALEQAAGGFGVLFVHFILPDFMGHEYGWMSPEYIKGIGQDDKVVGTLVDGLRAEGLLDNALLILTADHGGHDLTHGTNLKEDMTIPWIIYGAGVVAGEPITVPVSVMDTAATAVWGLGLAVPADWDGRPVVEAFGLQAEALAIPTASPSHCGI
jgi:predicted AlkP superfamily pyrophosphatase or phosphodiesterase